jgi:hypothetical protein
MDTIREIRTLRAYLIGEIDTKCNELILKLEQGGNSPEHEDNAENYESVYPLSVGPELFKGKKPTGVIFGKERIVVQTWKMVFKEIMCRCNKDPVKHMALMGLRNKISGRERIMLSDTPGKMRSPLEIDKKMYVETHYDTETLLRILLYRILDAVNYDYSKIFVALRNNKSGTGW